MKTSQTIDGKAEKFGLGPWVEEPDRVEWQHGGFACLMVRQPVPGHWCGYVGVEPGHPWHGKDWDHIDARVHGGITYARECEGDVCHVPEPGKPEHLWWIGFDCAHCDDLRPGDARLGYSLLTRGATYKTRAYVQLETRTLAEQARAAARASL